MRETLWGSSTARLSKLLSWVGYGYNDTYADKKCWDITDSYDLDLFSGTYDVDRILPESLSYIMFGASWGRVTYASSYWTAISGTVWYNYTYADFVLPSGSWVGEMGG